MAITDHDIILQYQGAAYAKELFDAADRLIRRLDGERIHKFNELDDAELIYDRIQIRNPSRPILEMLRRESQLDRNEYFRKANQLRAARDREDAKSFFGRIRLWRRNKERDRYIKQQQRKRAKAQS